jgi:hypothetical protein
MHRVLSSCLLGIIALAAAGLGRAEEAAAPGPVVELPKFIVTDNRELPPPESWQYGTFPGFEVLSNASVKNTQRLVKGFETFRMALGYVWPLPNRPAYPISLIVAGRGNKFDAFIPKGQDAGPTMARASLFLKQGERSAIVIDLQSKELTLLGEAVVDTASGLDDTRFSVDHDKQLYREYVRYLLSQSEPRLPAWFEEGLTQIIIAMRIDTDQIEFGRIEEDLPTAQQGMVQQMNALAAAAGESTEDSMLAAGAPSEDRDFNVALKRRALLSFPKFFAVQHNDPIAVNPLGNNLWAKQAYAFVHMCLYGYNGKYKKGFSQFLIRSTREPVTEELFKECFRIPKGKGKDGKETFREMGYKDMLLEIRSYSETTVYQAQGFRAAKGEKLPVPQTMALREATQSEVGRIKGETLVLAGNKEKARAELIAPYIRGERDPNLLTSLAVFDRAAGEDVRARKLFEAAITGTNKATGPDAYFEMARYRYADALAKPEGGDGKMSEAQAKPIIDLLIKARQQPPPVYPVYDLMAETWLRRAGKAKKEELGTLVDGLRMFPGRLKLAFQIGALAFDAGENELAHTMADHGLKYAPDAGGKARFQQLKSSLPPAAAPAAK